MKPSPTVEEILAALEEHGSLTKASRALGYNDHWLKHRCSRHPELRQQVMALRSQRDYQGNERKDFVPEEGPSREEMLQAELQELRSHGRKLRSIDIQVERVMQTIERTIRPAEPLYVPPPAPGRDVKTRHVKALVLSDLHCGEVVDREAVNGLNEFNWNVLVKRMAQVEKSLLSFAAADPFPVEELQIWLLGDNLSGNIHEEIAETNEFPEIEQSYRVGIMLGQFIERLVPHFPRIKVCGVSGNHPRQRKPHASKQVFNNLDWMAYKLLETHLARYDSVECDFPMSAFQVAEIAGQKILLWHGDGVRTSMPGVPWGGVMRRWNELSKQYAEQGTYLDGLAVGHFHQANVVQSKIFMNGSVIGLNEYGLKNFGSGERPTQLLLTFQPGKGRLTDVSYINP